MPQVSPQPFSSATQRQAALCLLTSFVREAARALLFALVVAGVAGAVGLGFWCADITLVQADVFATGRVALLASVLPAFFGAWAFFLLRKIAWSGPGEAFAVGATTAGLAVVAHRNVLMSSFFDLVSQGADPLSAWVGAATGLMPRNGAVDTLLLAEIGVVAGVGLAALAVQRLIVRRQ